MAALIFDNNTVSGGPYQFAYNTQAFRSSSGKLFVPFAKNVTGTTQKPIMFESTDDGATWSESDNTNAPTGMYLVQSMAKRPDLDYIHLAYFDTTASKLCLRRFDMLAGAWEASDIASGGPDYVDTSTVWGEPRLVIRCDDSVLVQIKTAAAGGFRQSGYALWDGATWTSGALGDIAAHHRPEAVYITPDQTAHFLMEKWPVSGKARLYHQAIQADGTIGSPELVDIFPSELPFNKTFAVVTSGGVVVTVYAEPQSFTSNSNPDHMPVTILTSGTGVSPTWSVACPWLYTDALNSPWLNYVPVAYRDAGLVWSEKQNDGTFKMYFHSETISGTELLWVQPALYWSGASEDNIIYGRGIDSAGFTGSARTIYNGTGTYKINDLRPSVLNPVSYCGVLMGCRYYANQ